MAIGSDCVAFVSIVSRLTRWSVAAALLLLALPPSTRWTWQVRHLPWALHAYDQAALLVGLAVGLLLAYWYRSQHFLQTLHHECCHALTCLILGVPVKAFSVSDQSGGAVVHGAVDPLRTTVISLAPYVLALPIMLLLVLLLLFDGAWLRWSCLGLVGALLPPHYRSLWSQVRRNWRGRESDLYRAGWLLSIAVIVVAQVLLLGWILRGIV